jgi:hypothetical protein
MDGGASADTHHTRWRVAVRYWWNDSRLSAMIAAGMIE